MTRQGWLGVALIVAGGVLALVFRDAEFLWFRGGPLGILLVVVGVLDLAESWRRARRAVQSSTQSSTQVSTTRSRPGPS